jgi:hypothetical protein
VYTPAVPFPVLQHSAEVLMCAFSVRWCTMFDAVSVVLCWVYGVTWCYWT